MKRANRGQRIDTVFVLFIFSIFAVSVLIVLMLGANIYQNISELSQEGADERLVLSYIWTKTKKTNDAGNIYVSDFYGENAIIIEQYIGERLFQTVVYYEDGWLMELFSEKVLGLNRTNGTRILEVGSLTFEEVSHGLIKVTTGDRDLFIYPLQ